MNLEKICAEVCELATEVGDFIRKMSGKVAEEKVHSKALNSLVSFVDIESEKQLVKGLAQILPTAAFITEENTIIQNDAPYQWIVDPLDGTTNFLHQLPIYAISIALMKNKKTVLGVVLEVNRSECFYSIKGGKAYLNGTEIQVSKTLSLANALVATGFPYTNFDYIDTYLDVLKYLMQKTRGIRRLGAASVDLCYVACGKFDAFFEYGLAPWDVAAGAFIVEQAGGSVSDFKNGQDFVFKEQIIATNECLQPAIIEQIKRYKLSDKINNNTFL